MSIVVLISGNGSNLQALIDAQLPASISHVISSSADAYGLERARKAGIPHSVHSLQSYYQGVPVSDKDERKKRRQTFDKELAKKITALHPKLVVCAGWMLILSPAFLDPISEAGISIINLHPALPGTFLGLNAIERAWEAGRRGEITEAGLMIHYVTAAVDEGEPLIVKKLLLNKDETLEKYEERIHAAEHEAIVEGTIKAYESIAAGQQ